MVHFASQFEAIHLPIAPPVCPKCGSHRTQIIGKSDDPTKNTLRCNACGAISTVPVNEAAAFVSDYAADATSAA
jgi:transcription elongation factor Elf1